MSLKSIAQDIAGTPFVIIEQVGQPILDHPTNTDPVEGFLSGEPSSELVLEEPEEEHEHGHELEVQDSETPMEVVIKFDGVDGDLPGAPESPFVIEEEKPLEVSEEDVKDNDKADADENDAKKKKNDKWDWKSRGSEGFIEWIRDRFNDVPKHSGYDISGVQRACSYLEFLDSEVSKAMRLDINGELEANKIEEVRSKIENGIDRLNDRIEQIKKSKKNKKKKKK